MSALVDTTGVVLDYGPEQYCHLVQKHLGGSVVPLTADQLGELIQAESIGLWATIAIKEVHNG